MFDSAASPVELREDCREIGTKKSHSAELFLISKRMFDLIVSTALLLILVPIALVLLVLNPFFNPGPLWFSQKRMGRDCEPFTALKFRTMRCASESTRSANCPLETDRITPLGGLLRKSRIDELPQVLNVLRGDMSLIGPRPDHYDHARYFLNQVPRYRRRHRVRPGISGLAQTEVGYVEGAAATRRKVAADLYYIANSGFRLEAWVVLRTLAVILGRAGS